MAVNAAHALLLNEFAALLDTAETVGARFLKGAAVNTEQPNRPSKVTISELLIGDSLASRDTYSSLARQMCNLTPGSDITETVERLERYWDVAHYVDSNSPTDTTRYRAEWLYRTDPNRPPDPWRGIQDQIADTYAEVGAPSFQFLSGVVEVANRQPLATWREIREAVFGAAMPPTQALFSLTEALGLLGGNPARIDGIEAELSKLSGASNDGVRTANIVLPSDFAFAEPMTTAFFAVLLGQGQTHEFAKDAIVHVLLTLRSVPGSTPKKGELLVLYDGRSTLGRSPESDIFVTNPHISRNHCAFVSDDGRLLVEHKGGTNGTLVNGAAITKAELHTLDVIQLGSVVLRYAGSRIVLAGSALTADQLLAQTDNGLVSQNLAAPGVCTGTAISDDEKGADIDKRAVEIFVSWAHQNKRVKSLLLELVKTRLSIARGWEFSWWEDSDLDIGSAWDPAIKSRLYGCDYALQLISPEFFASQYIREYEIPPFVRGEKRALPVGLVPVPFDGTADLLGVEELQVFRFRDRFFSELTDSARRVKFADALVAKILAQIVADRTGDA